MAAVLFFSIFFTVSEVLARVDLSRAGICNVAGDDPLTTQSIHVLREEVARRTGIWLPVSVRIDNHAGPTVFLVLETTRLQLPAPLRKALDALPKPSAEGFRIVTQGNDVVVIEGKDARGLLYGIGRLLRKAEMTSGRIVLAGTLHLSSSPKYMVRGHQLGYRPKTNSYDAFTVAGFDQYIRELALFGANSIEIMPSGTDDDSTSRHMKLPAMEMVAAQSRICIKYGLDCWMWYPNIGKGFSDPAKVSRELLVREEVFRNVPKLDAIFVPGGDPGELEPDELFTWLGKVAGVLKKHHPKAKIWVSPQSFKPEKAWFDAFFRHVNSGYPWLGGIVFGPWVKVPVEQIRKIVKPSIPIRNYPDITHSIACQYPEPDWDPAWAMTLGREAINPRPTDEKLFHNAVAPYCIGSISYSEGTNDDVNKFIWSDQDWNPATDVRETLKDYSRLFLGADLADEGALALAALEQNVKGPVLAAAHIDRTLQRWQAMERTASPSLRANPRFQMGLIRAYFDAYIRERSLYEAGLERQAYAALTSSAGSAKSRAQQALAMLRKAWEEPVAAPLKARCLALADSLYRSIGAQLTVARHGAMPGRGNFIDNLDYPLNDAPWLVHELKKTADMDEAGAAKVLDALLNRTYPGKGGTYDHFLSPLSRARVLGRLSREKDPGSLQSPRVSYTVGLPGKDYYEAFPGVTTPVPVVPKAWHTQIEVLYENVLRIACDQLDPGAVYKVRVVYTGRFKSTIRMKTADNILIHDYIKAGLRPEYEFDLPAGAIKNGKVIFEWNCKAGERGLQLAELSLIRVN
ncbi:hypothetical protein BLX24_06160 [Arsenicibacter rosenii]|uniref:Alpha glucuronidase N-terminal domain-containing protein n=1 Tax=Arsenicibacter rosenii TaxID=1750698 RepID=A0A1S2VQ88_9BACT|nr:hypothetical protein BLX24_06160 [Arsenicibacter rosenii]